MAWISAALFRANWYEQMTTVSFTLEWTKAAPT